MKDNTVLSIHFIDGTVMSFQFSQKDSEDVNIAKSIGEVFKYEYFVIELEGSSLFFLPRNIKYIETRSTSGVETWGKVLRGLKLCD